MANCDEFLDVDRKPARRGFAKIDVVDVILSDEAFEVKNKPNILEQIADNALKQKGPSDALKGLAYEPTYRQMPRKRFDADVVNKIIEQHLEKELRELSYSEKDSVTAVKRIAYCLRKEIKKLYSDRYRLIIQVRIIEKVNQGMETRIGFLWDSNYDAFASYSMETNTFAAYAVVYAIYKE